MNLYKKKILLANWKMNLRLSESSALAEAYKKKLKKVGVADTVIVGVCPSFDALDRSSAIFKRTRIMLGAQDVFWEDDGAFTGEISAPMLVELGCRFVLIGHSERRAHLHEDNEMINLKIRSAISAGLVPVLCVGETMEERQEQRHDLQVMTQVVEALNGIALHSDDAVIVAYEPRWVIGTGQAIDATEAARMVSVIRQALIDVYPLEQVNQQTAILYGGSVDASNVQEFVDDELIQGILVGSASLNADKFISMLDKIS